jgi:hypothetical protein
MTQAQVADVSERWKELLELAGPLAECQTLEDEQAAHGDPGAGALQIDVRELFVRADPAQRRSLDLLGVAMAERRAGDAGGSAHELVVLESDTMRSQALATAPGHLMTDLRLGRAATGLISLSMIVVQVARQPRLRDIVASIEDYARMLDYERDGDGSRAVADAALRRLAVLMRTDGVSVSLAGIVRESPEPATRDSYRLLVADDADGALRVRDGRLVTVAPDGRPQAWRRGDFALLRFGRPRAEQHGARSLHQLRREHALADAALEQRTEAPENEESYSERAARARQSSTAERIVRAALSGDTATAASAFRAALVQPGADGPLVDSLSDRVTRTTDYWAVDDVLRGVHDDAGAPEALRDVAGEVRVLFRRRLDELCGLRAQTAEMFLPVVTPIVVELSDALVPFVDQKADGGLFLDQLIPAMKQRVLEGMGVPVPGIRARPNSSLPPGSFSVQVDEVPVLTSFIGIDTWVEVIPTEPARVFEDQLTDVHPLTGERGMWRLKPDEDEGEPDTGEGVGGVARMSTPQHLVHLIELVVRRHLKRWLTLDDVRTLVERWAEHDERGLVQSTLAGDRASERLAWVLHALVDDGVPITDWTEILTGIQDAGGITRRTSALVRAARARLADRLPRADSATRVIDVPPDYEERLVARVGPHHGDEDRVAQLELMHWLRGIVASLGPAVSLVTRTDEGREAVAALVRPQYRLITTLTHAERGFRGE